MNLTALPAFADNYIWMLHDGAHAIVVDPGEAAPVESALRAHGLALVGILVTHHHHDHVGGVDALRSLLSGPVFAPAGPYIPEPSTTVSDGTVLQVLGCRVDVLAVPGHTLDHVAYVLQPPGGEAAILFSGDTLFSAGCGRLFEGTPAQMQASLDRLAALPHDTHVCCGHEYTLSNLRFAQAVEPDNADIAAHAAACATMRQEGIATLPSTVGRELAINPFLRCAEPAVVRSARANGAPDADRGSVFTALRRWKNDHR